MSYPIKHHQIHRHKGPASNSDNGFFWRCICELHRYEYDRCQLIVDTWGGKRAHQKRIKLYRYFFRSTNERDTAEIVCKRFFGPRFVKIDNCKTGLYIILLRDKTLNKNIEQNKAIVDLMNI